jgi:membrane dipeptidase
VERNRFGLDDSDFGFLSDFGFRISDLTLNSTTMLIFDAHLDLAMNALEWNRDLTRPLSEIREREHGLTDKSDRGRGTVSLPELRRANIGLVVATQIARYSKPSHPLPGWRSPAQAWAMTQGQLAWYRTMEEAGEMVQITDRAGLEAHFKLWMEGSHPLTPSLSPAPSGGEGARRAGEGVVPMFNVQRPTLNVQRSTLNQQSTISNQQSTISNQNPLAPSPAPNAGEGDRGLPIGYILSLEGADSMVTPAYVERSHAQGLRAIGPAHYGPGTYAFGTDSEGGIGQRGRELLKEMERLGMILDATHLCDTSFREALEVFGGPIWASHSNCRALTPHNRQFTDDQIKELLARGAVIGAPLDAWMMIPNWVRGQTTPQGTGLKLEKMVDHIDHICQLAGNASHCGIGTDLDGGFGREQCPMDLDTIADLQRVPDLLRARGYSPADVEGMMHGNFLRFLREAWR